MDLKETPGERFFNIIKNTGYTCHENFSAKNFEYLFAIPDTAVFFNWFLQNVDENCVLSKDELARFTEKAANNQVIYDLNRLNDLSNSLKNPSMVNSNATNILDRLNVKLSLQNKEIFEETKDEDQV